MWLLKLVNNKTKKERKVLSKEDRTLWDLYTRNLKNFSKKSNKASTQKTELKKNKLKIKKSFTKLDFGQKTALSKKNFRAFKRGNIFIEKKLDLHGYTKVEARKKLKEFINLCLKEGKRFLLVITGKGKKNEGVIKENISNWLNEKELRPKILSINHASQKHGGVGAIYIFLKKT